MGDRLFFGPFELRTDSGELFRDGARLPLQPQPARLLELLARRSGEVVSREEIRRQLWGEDTFIEFETALNFSVRKIRMALADSASEPSYLETVPRRGYRFLPPVRTGPVEDVGPPRARPGSHRRIIPLASAGFVTCLMLLAMPREPSPRSPRSPAGGGTAAGAALSGSAFRAYTEGRFFAERDGPGDRERALAALADAMRLAPGAARPYAAYARLRLQFGRPPEEVVAPAEEPARRALALDPCLNEARLVLVDIGLYFRFDWQAAKAELDRALACDPDDSAAHGALAAYLAAHGQLDPAIAAARRAQLLDPKSQLAAADLAWYSFLARRYDEALDLARRTLALEPDDTWTRLVLVEAADRAGRPEIALAEANAMLATARSRNRLPVPPERVDDLGLFWDWILRRKAVLATRAPRSPLDLAAPLLQLGKTDRALRLVEEAGRRKLGWELAFLAVDPRFDPLREEPRFQQVLRSLGLQDAGEEPGPSPARGA